MCIKGREFTKSGGGAQINAAFISTESLMHTRMCGRSVVGVVS